VQFFASQDGFAWASALLVC